MILLPIFIATLVAGSHVDNFDKMLAELRQGYRKDIQFRAEMGPSMATPAFIEETKRSRLQMKADQEVIDFAASLVQGTPEAAVFEQISELSKQMNELASGIPSRHLEEMTAQIDAIVSLKRLGQDLKDILVLSKPIHDEIDTILASLEASEAVYAQERSQVQLLLDTHF